jgi:hypothetical protein
LTTLGDIDVKRCGFIQPLSQPIASSLSSP